MKKLILLMSLLLTLTSINAQSVSDAEITKMHLIFKTHLDIGFTDLGSNVLSTYVNDFIPAAFDLSENIAKENGIEKYPWTTGSWLMWNYMELASPANRKRMEEAITRNDFFWHAFPFTVQAEVCDSSLFASSFAISRELDSRFERKTISAKMTDVPGITRSVIPIMHKNGIRLLHIGTNPCVPVPKVPELFCWQAPDGSQVNVIHQLGYGECIKLPGTQIGAYICFTSDNHGPHTKTQIAEIYRDVRKRFPNAEIIGSSLDNVAADIDKYCTNLPVVTQEIGDTWIWGVASDPKKVAEMRQLMRLRNEWIATGKLETGSSVDKAFSMPLLMVSEHTWGLDVKWNLHNWDKYAPEQFEAFAGSPIFDRMERSWNEKRAFITTALAALPSNLQREAMTRMGELTPERQSENDGYRVVDTQKNSFKNPFFELSFDPNTGAIILLCERKTKQQWADGTHPIGEFAYQTFSEEVFHKFIASYCPPNPPDWAKLDYGKHQLAQTNTPHKTWTYKLKQLSSKSSKNALHIRLQLEISQSQETYGAPKEVEIEYVLSNTLPQIEINLCWFDKNKTRIPEALWFSFVPKLGNSQLLLDKMGSLIDVTDVVENGSRHQHAVGNYVKFTDNKSAFKINSMDAPIVVLNSRDLMYFDNTPVDVSKGIHYCLFNNCWGTNYTQWFGDDMKFRFIITPITNLK